MTRDPEISPQPALLGFLMAHPQHGYELHQEFSRDLGQVWRVGLSQIYAQLKQMEEAGLVAAQTEPQPNRPPRKVYHITPAGREHSPARAAAQTDDDFARLVLEFRQGQLKAAIRWLDRCLETS